MTPLLEVALAAVRAGLSVHPPVEDGTKAPLPFYAAGSGEDGKPKKTWLHPDGRPADEELVRRWFGRCRGIGLRCGAEGGGVECFEFDHRATYEAFVAAARACDLGELVARIEAGYREETPGEGIHWLYTCPEVRGNTKLARAPEPTAANPRAVQVLIETRGENGYVIIAPTAGPVHPTGRPYVLTSGGVDTIASITEEERDAL